MSVKDYVIKFLFDDTPTMKRSRKYLSLIIMLICTFLIMPFFLFHLPQHYEVARFRNHIASKNVSYFFAANFFNNEAILPHWSKEFIRLVTLIGPERVFLSVYENDSKDNTKQLLEQLKRELSRVGVKHSIIMENNDMRKNYTDRIEYLAVVRNYAMEPLFNFVENRTHPHTNMGPYLGSLFHSKYSRVIFINDIYFTALDMVRLISTHSHEYDIACGLDFYQTFYDQYATRDIRGDWFAKVFPYSREPYTQQLARQYKDFPVYSCWNGAAVMDVEPFYRHKVQFRGNGDNAECIHSECFLICEDFRRLNYTSVYINPRIKFTYTYKDHLFQRYIMSVADFFLSIFYYPTSNYEPPDLEQHRNAFLDVQCGIPPDS